MDSLELLRYCGAQLQSVGFFQIPNSDQDSNSVDFEHNWIGQKKLRVYLSPKFGASRLYKATEAESSEPNVFDERESWGRSRYQGWIRVEDTPCARISFSLLDFSRMWMSEKFTVLDPNDEDLFVTKSIGIECPLFRKEDFDEFFDSYIRKELEVNEA